MFPVPKPQIKKATMYNILIIYSSNKTGNIKYIQVHYYATVPSVCIKTILKIIWYFKNQILYLANTLGVAIRETGSSEIP